MIAKKKNKKADLERKRFAFFQIGLIVAGAMCLAAFEYSTLTFDELANNEMEIDNNSLYNTAPPKEYIEQQKPAVQKKVQIKVITEVTPSDKKQVKTTTSPNDSKNIKMDVDADWGEDGEDGVIVNTVKDSVYEVPQVMPEFPGGVVAMGNWINSHLELPHYAEPLSGTVYVRFIVDKDGTITNVSLSKGIHSDYDKASLAVVQQMPRWKPGQQAGKKVKVRYDLPIKFLNR